MAAEDSWDKAARVREILAFRGERPTIDLDDLAEIVAPHGLSTAQLDELLTAVEEAGCVVVMGEQPRLSEELVIVLAAVRTLSGRHGRRPTVRELAELTALAEPVVWRALRYGRVLGR